MAKGKNERIERTDPKTGARVTQLTSFPLIHYHQYCYGQWISPDSRTLLLFGYREPRRDSPIDLRRVNCDGTDLALVSKNATWSTITPDGESVYVGHAGCVTRTPLFGGDEEEVFRSEEYASFLVSAASPDGRYLFLHARRQEGMHALLRYDVRERRARTLFETAYLMHVQLHNVGAGGLLATVTPPGKHWGIWTFDFDGGNFRELPFPRSSNHFASLGTSGKVISTVRDLGNAIEIAEPGDAEPRTLVSGEGFWHPTCDATGEWIACDTNWPDTGLMLVHAPSGRYRPLCFTGTSGGHPQWTHAHPRMAPDGSYVVFDSDATGIGQVYAAFVPEEFKAALRSGTTR